MAQDFLEKIVAHKKEAVALSMAATPLTALRERASLAGPGRGFLISLADRPSQGVNIIAEIKRASPSKGIIRGDLDAARQARLYEAGGARALSVLTDERFFQGSLEDLTRARSACRLPVLRKDFIVSAYQIYEAKAFQADAVLLIVRILTRETLKDYLALCREIDLDALVEIHGEKDLETATLAGARLIGINNRDLSSFATSLDVAPRLAALMRPGQIPVAASGIQGREDIMRHLKAGIYNFLIGESLVRAEDPATFLRTLAGAGGESP